MSSDSNTTVSRYLEECRSGKGFVSAPSPRGLKKMIKNPIKNPIFTKSGAARAYTVRYAGMSPRPPAGGHRAPKKTHVPGNLAGKRATDLSKTVSETGEADQRFW